MSSMLRPRGSRSASSPRTVPSSDTRRSRTTSAVLDGGPRCGPEAGRCHGPSKHARKAPVPGDSRWKLRTGPVARRNNGSGDRPRPRPLPTPNALTGRIGIAQVTAGAGFTRHLRPPSGRKRARPCLPMPPATTKLAICGLRATLSASGTHAVLPLTKARDSRNHANAGVRGRIATAPSKPQVLGDHWMSLPDRVARG